MKSRKIFIYSLFFILLTISLFSIYLISDNLTSNFLLTTPSVVRIDPGIKVYYSDYNGSTTDFIFLNDSSLETIENMTLENTSYGKIVFIGDVNLTQDAILNIVDLDYYGNISNSSIFINTSVLTSLLRNAQVTFYNVSLNNPIIYINNVTCSSSDCPLLSQNGGTYVYNVSTNVLPYANITLTEELPKTWERIKYPQGVYEPYDVGLAGKHLHNFNITFISMNASSGDEIGCYISQSDGSTFFLNETLTSNYNSQNYSLNYTISQSDSVLKTTRWEVINCSITNSSGIVSFDNDYNFSRLKRTIMVHDNNWTRFSSSADDAYRAGRCFLGFPKRYFNNSYYCDYVGDVAFSVSMSLGMNLEGDCTDGIDNDGNGDVDCDDRYCRGLPYLCIDHAYAGDPFEGTCTNGICTESRTFGVPAKTITYTYTRYVKPSGTLKVRFQANSYSTSSPVLYSITDIATGKIAAYGNYTRSGYTMLDTISSTATSVAAESASGHSGSVDFVMYVNFSNYDVGWHNLSFYLVHQGQDLLVAGIPIYVSSGATSNWYENETSSYTTLPCANSVDEDLDYENGCSEIECNGEIGGTDCGGGNAYCEYGAETICYDCFDNDASGSYDCGESSCDLQRGGYTNSSILCHYNGEGDNTYDLSSYTWINACADGFNNDQQDGTDCYDTTSCFGRGGNSTTLPCPANENNDASWCFDNIDNDYDGSMDCNDADCVGVTSGINKCPTREMETTTSENNSLQCFDGSDNDYDGSIDCADTVDCAGVINLFTNMGCHGSEYNSSFDINSFGGFNVIEYLAPRSIAACLNNQDDDNDGASGCNDADCNGKSGDCGPCPSVENVSFTSCANNLNDDYAGGSDCADSDCVGMFGEFTDDSGAVKCQASENNATLCFDYFDNDADGYVDCADSDCDGFSFCEYASESTCADEYDNDADGYVDCADSNCFGSGSCDSLSWTPGSCTVIPANGSVSLGSVSASYLTKHHINTDYTITLTGSGSYDSLTITLGDATNSSLYFPYDATSCVLSGDTSKVRWVASQTSIGQLQDQGSFTGGFTAMLTCNSLGTAQTNSYSLITSNQVDGSTESYQETLSTTIYENTAPSVGEVEQSRINVRYGEDFHFRGIPSNDPSNICTCLFNVSGSTSSVDGNCILAMNTQVTDQNYSVSVAAKDGASNTGSYTSFGNYPVNVMVVANSVSIDKYFHDVNNLNNIVVASEFQTATNGAVNVCTASIINSSNGDVLSSQALSISGTSTVSCTGTIDISSLSEGDYIVSIYAEDDDLDNTTIETVFSICGDSSSSPMCAYLDLDEDGIPDNKDCKYLLPFMSYPIDVNISTTYYSSTDPSPKFYFYQNQYNNTLFTKDTSGSTASFEVVEDIYDLQISSYEDNFSMRFNGMNITNNISYVVELDNLDNINTYGYKTYAVDITPESQINTTITLKYSGLNYTAEENLTIYVCSDWDISGRNCYGNWTQYDATQELVEDTLTITYNGSFQAGFSINDEVPTLPTTPPTVEEEEVIFFESKQGLFTTEFSDLAFKEFVKEAELGVVGEKPTEPVKTKAISFNVKKKQISFAEVFKSIAEFHFVKLFMSSFLLIFFLVF